LQDCTKIFPGRYRLGTNVPAAM